MLKILILGGYGGVGKSLSTQLLKHIDAEISVSGRNVQKLELFTAQLKKEFPYRKISSVFVDVRNQDSVCAAFKKVDLAIITTTTPEYMNIIAEAALVTNTDLIDIFVRGDVIETLEKYRNQIINNKRIFITQAGFHPGLATPFIKYGNDQFDKLQSANIVMAMNSEFEKPESTYEIIHEIGVNSAMILKDNNWKKANYKDYVQIDFSEDFGTLKCYPLSMREIIPLHEELGIQNMGVYSAGFNPFVDN